MIDIGNILGGGAAIGDMINNIIRGQQITDIEQQNLQLQKDTFAYQQGVQREIFNREDSAIQRRVADLKAAGLSPVLAAGQGARAGAPINVTAPQRGTTGKQIQAQAMAGMAKELSDVSKTVAEIKLINAQKNKTNKEADQISSMLPLQLSKLQADIKKISTDIRYTNAKTATEQERANHYKLENEYNSSTMQNRITIVTKELNKTSIDLKASEVELVMRTIDQDLYQQMHKWLLDETKSRGYLFTPATIDLMTADMLWKQRGSDIRWHNEKGLPYTGKGLDIKSMIIDAIMALTGMNMEDFTTLNPTWRD